MSDDLLPIRTLISNRCDELSLRPSELVRRCGYKNISKGLRRLEASLKADVQLTSTASASTDWVATFRGRVGLTEGNLLVYVTGGFAISQIKFNQANTYAGLGTESFASSSTETGWTAGAGAEYALNRNWAIRGEYLRIEFDDVGGTAPFFGLHTHSLGDLDTNLVRGGVNYRF